MKVKEYLESKGIEVTLDGGYFWNCQYKGNTICVMRNSGISNTFALYVNMQTVATKALIRTCVGKILNLKEV